MRDIPEDLAARIESGAATLCHAWLLTRADGRVLGFTDHDRDLFVEGVTCRAASGWTAGASDAGVGMTCGSAAVQGGLDDDAITEGDVQAGLYDRATVELWRVDWERPDLRVRSWVSTLAKLRRDGDGFTAELEGPMAALERVVGRTYGKMCDALLGDERCGVDVATHAGKTCDKRWSTCVDVFGNAANFRGFPDIPGDDFLTAVPREGGRNDGSSRR